METPINFLSNQARHSRGPKNAGYDLTLQTENTVMAQSQQASGNNVARGAQVHIPDLNLPPKLYECFICQTPFQSLRAVCAHMKKHRYRSWKGLKPPSNVVSFDLNEFPNREHEINITSD